MKIYGNLNPIIRNIVKLASYDLHRLTLMF